MATYADVVLPLPLENSYTYQIPSSLEGLIVSGSRVIVPFGKRRYYTAIVLTVYKQIPKEIFAGKGYAIKEISTLLDTTPIVRRPQLRFWQWISSYYLCKLGDVYKAAVPSGLKLESETVVTYHEDIIPKHPLKTNEQKLLDAFTKGEVKITISELEKRTGLRNTVALVVSLMKQGLISVDEVMKKGFVTKKRTYIRLADQYANPTVLEELFQSLNRAFQQQRALIAFLSFADSEQLRKEGVAKKALMEYGSLTDTHLRAMVKKGIFVSFEREVDRLHHSYTSHLSPPKKLTVFQKQAYDNIHSTFKEKDVCLLHGVMSSGKTEIYVQLINDTLQLGRQALYLLPEIAITTQITDRLSRIFGDKLFVYHSKFSDNERVEIWNKLLHSKEPCVVLGVRSSLFLPFYDLGLVIVDEEHEYSYKQQDPTPRYHARNAAIILAGMHGGKVLLGSATPSVDSYFNTTTGKYGLVELKERYGECLMPEIIPVDLKELRRKKIMKDTLFSPLLVSKISQALEQQEQVILFQNRRGFAPQIECKACGWVPYCPHCDVSLTYHKYRSQLICHYCGFTQNLSHTCPACEGKELRTMGFGTEKVEEEITTLFPQARIGRLDTDTARSRTGYEQILTDFEKKKTDILIGTQMISKGLDFGNVTVVGILYADTLMNFPDFRSHERAFQLMLQVSGRAGRRDKQGTVVLQTAQPAHPLIQLVKQFDYKGMVELQLQERQLFRYPPYYRLITLVFRSRHEASLQEASTYYADLLKKQLGERVLGPVIPIVTRIQSMYIRQILLKIELSVAINPLREFLLLVQSEAKKQSWFKQVQIYYDVDPV